MVLAVGVAEAAKAGEKQSFKGTYTSDREQGKTKLKATFAPTGPGTWTVKFRFFSHGSGHVFSGTAEGSLSAGSLRGTVKTSDQTRTFTFHGQFSEGRFEGTHAEVLEEGERPTGTLTLTR